MSDSVLEKVGALVSTTLSLSLSLCLFPVNPKSLAAILSVLQRVTAEKAVKSALVGWLVGWFVGWSVGARGNLRGSRARLFPWAFGGF